MLPQFVSSRGKKLIVYEEPKRSWHQQAPAGEDRLPGTGEMTNAEEAHRDSLQAPRCDQKKQRWAAADIIARVCAQDKLMCGVLGQWGEGEGEVC